MGKDLKKHWYSKMWDFVTRPKTLYDEAKVNKDADGKKIDKKLKDKEGLGFFATLKHIFWPSSTGGKLAYGTVAATAAAGVVGGFKYAEHREGQRKSSSHKKLGLAVAGLAAAGATAFGAYKGHEWYQAKQNAGEGEMFDDEETGAPQSSGKNSDPAPVSASGDQSKKNKNKPKPTKKSNKWMIWAAVIVLALAVIGGAVYYFLFMTEEGSEEDPVPEGMDQV